MGAESLCQQNNDNIDKDEKGMVTKHPTQTSYFGACDELGRPNR